MRKKSKRNKMYIEKYWGNYIGDTDDSLTLVSYLADKQKTEISLHEIFVDIGLEKQNGVFKQTTVPLEVTCSDGLELAFYYAVDLITDLAALLLECKINGEVNLHDLDDFDAPKRVIRITATPKEHEMINKSLADFFADPLSYDLSEMVPKEDMEEMAAICEKLRRELYE